MLWLLDDLATEFCERLRGKRKGQYSIASMTSGASVLNGAMGMPMKLRLWIITRRQQDGKET